MVISKKKVLKDKVLKDKVTKKTLEERIAILEAELTKLKEKINKE